MKHLLILITALMLTGCLTTTVKQKFPDVPAGLLTACPSLEQIDPATTKLSEVVRVVTDNYSQYHECRVKIDAWIEWYQTQKSIFQEVK
jgi:hypothetical protein